MGTTKPTRQRQAAKNAPRATHDAQSGHPEAQADLHYRFQRGGIVYTKLLHGAASAVLHAYQTGTFYSLASAMHNLEHALELPK